MQVKLAQNYGFCFGVKRAIKIAQDHKDSVTLGPLIHNAKEISRLKRDFNVDTSETLENLQKGRQLIVRTHGIPKNDLKKLQNQQFDIIDATCPYVRKPQMIVEEMSKEGYDIIVFGDKEHPEVKGVVSYAENGANVVANFEELQNLCLGKKITLISQTTKQPEVFAKIAGYLSVHCAEVRVFNTICNATFDNQIAADTLSKEVDIMIIVGGKNSSNTKQLFMICKNNCAHSYLVEDESELECAWFEGKKICGITAGASTPDWIIQKVQEKVLAY
ncbi:4-hydroxy-3-methylbut-2-enyl diphosphate reductase [Helicobacter himalayensis]|uniref:4-hydroxy-3-methylbut-2-enyl diphosphate reductase n=1 Tax=Helicobacter himalayensis TaxID=1591088 RepID=UPI003D6FDD74